MGNSSTTSAKCGRCKTRDAQYMLTIPVDDAKVNTRFQAMDYMRQQVTQDGEQKYHDGLRPYVRWFDADQRVLILRSCNECAALSESVNQMQRVQVHIEKTSDEAVHGEKPSPRGRRRGEPMGGALGIVLDWIFD